MIQTILAVCVSPLIQMLVVDFCLLFPIPLDCLKTLPSLATKETCKDSISAHEIKHVLLSLPDSKFLSANIIRYVLTNACPGIPIPSSHVGMVGIHHYQERKYNHDCEYYMMVSLRYID